MTVSIWPLACSSLKIHAPANDPTTHAARDQHAAHLGVHSAAPEMREHARHARARHLAGGGGGGDGRGGCHRRSAAAWSGTRRRPEHARQQAHARAQRDDDKRVDRQVGDRKIQVHGRVITAWAFPNSVEGLEIARQGERRAGAGAARPAILCRQSERQPDAPIRDRQRDAQGRARIQPLRIPLRPAPQAQPQVDRGRQRVLARTAPSAKGSIGVRATAPACA